MSELQIFENLEFGNIRTIVKNDEIWFVAKDICNCLEIGNSSQALSRLDEDEKDIILTDTCGGKQEMSYVNESGLYKLINTSNKKTANYKYRLIDWFKSLGFLQCVSFATRGEAEFLEALTKALEYSGLTTKSQFVVDGFKLDIYIPELNVAIEFDEKAHKYQKEKDTDREASIKQSINCEFIRVDEQDGLFYNIGKVITIINNLKGE